MLPLKNKTILENAVGCFFTFSKAMFLSKFDEFKQTDGKLPWICCCEVPRVRSSSQREAFGKGAQDGSARSLSSCVSPGYQHKFQWCCGHRYVQGMAEASYKWWTYRFISGVRTWRVTDSRVWHWDSFVSLFERYSFMKSVVRRLNLRWTVDFYYWCCNCA